MRSSPWLRLLPALLYTAGIFYGGVINLGPFPETEGFPVDKVMHAAAFMGLEWLAELALSHLPSARRRFWAVSATVGAGVLLEAVQASLPHRSAEWLDLLADTLGALTGAAVLAVVGARRRTAVRS